GAERRGKPARERLVAAAAERDGRRPFRERRLEPEDAATFLVHRDPERPVAPERRDLARELRDLCGIDDVAGEVHHAAEIERREERAEASGTAVAVETDDGKAADVAPELPKRHPAAIIMRGTSATGRAIGAAHGTTPALFANA